MITRYFWEDLILKSITTTSNTSGEKLPTIYGDKDKFTISNYGYLITPILFRTKSFVGALSDVNMSGGIVLGTGTTPPTEYDTNLSGNYITTNQVSTKITISYSYNAETQQFSIIRNIQATNISDSPITIGELGIFSLQQLQQYTYTRFLLDHTILDSPITIEPNAIGQIVYEIKINVPSR